MILVIEENMKFSFIKDKIYEFSIFLPSKSLLFGNLLDVNLFRTFCDNAVSSDDQMYTLLFEA